MNPRDNPTMRLVSYNILDGGLGRLDPLKETLAFLNGDVVGLIEADDPAGSAYLANQLGYELISAEGAGGRHHVACLSRLPVQRMINLGVCCDTLGRGAMEIIVPGETRGGVLRVIVVHFKAGIRLSDEAIRLRQVEQLLAWLAREPMPTIIMGDLNANAPYHPVDLAAARPKTQQNVAAQNGVIPHDVINHFTAAGWVDALHRAHPDQPVHTLTPGFPAQRVDYILLDSTLAPNLADARVDRSAFTAYCSDHYPIWADLRRFTQ
jgi:endonuclease/exonuclease/phosphatase family metal-dependent hydrolase